MIDKKLLPPLKAAVAFLEQAGFEYSVIGGIALSQWGVVRVTRDVDLKVLVPDTDYDGVRAAITNAFPIGARQNLPHNPLIVSVEIRDVVVDFLLTVPGYEEEIVARAERRDFNGIFALVCSAEDLIIQKVIANRGRDWPDIEALLIEMRGKLDYKYIENWLSEFATALGDSELFQRYQELKQEIDDLARDL